MRTDIYVHRQFVRDGSPGQYASRLLAALGDNEKFMPIFNEIKGLDREATVAIANEFNGPMAPSTSRTKAQERILSRHRKLVEFTSHHMKLA